MPATNLGAGILFFAEREGFEPPEPRSSTVFKTAAIDHSAIFPGAKLNKFLFRATIISFMSPV